MRNRSQDETLVVREPSAVKVARWVPRGWRRSNALLLPAYDVGE
jgi:hypothetical protein